MVGGFHHTQTVLRLISVRTIERNPCRMAVKKPILRTKTWSMVEHPNFLTETKGFYATSSLAKGNFLGVKMAKSVYEISKNSPPKLHKMGLL